MVGVRFEVIYGKDTHVAEGPFRRREGTSFKMNCKFSSDGLKRVDEYVRATFTQGTEHSLYLSNSLKDISQQVEVITDRPRLRDLVSYPRQRVLKGIRRQ